MENSFNDTFRVAVEACVCMGLRFYCSLLVGVQVFFFRFRYCTFFNLF